VYPPSVPNSTKQPGDFERTIGRIGLSAGAVGFLGGLEPFVQDALRGEPGGSETPPTAGESGEEPSEGR
jgi:hypothetical protein